VTNLNLLKNKVPITEIEQSAFCRTDELSVKPLEEEIKAPVRWQPIPKQYLKLDGIELHNRIIEAKNKLGNRATILGHHYQRDEVIRYADATGDSFKLSQFSATQESSEFFIFCGVHFMAETADILSNDRQKVILPNLTAGCSMADMADIDDVLDCWDDLTDILGADVVVPITYMNSTASIKALCGRNGGIVCTSSNAVDAFEWAFSKSSKVLFLPDQHLGRNTGVKMGIPVEDMLVWNPNKQLGGHTEEEFQKAKVILWQGHCSVHTRFKLNQVKMARQKYSDIKILVHPECTLEVVDAADMVGSTEYIIKAVSNAPSGSVWGIGTEISLVNRLAQENPDKTVFCLDSVVCPCSTMYRIHPAYLAWVLDQLCNDTVVNQITVEPKMKIQAKRSLDRMLALKP
tara:strand:- start:4467 stop:5675 length:1209 start_codon:yes stop_codon:yes gene_type:complete